MLREQFEQWCRKEHPVWFSHQIHDDTIRIEQLWQAYQAGHAASGRDELLAACEKAMDFADSDYVPNGLFDRISKAIKKAKGETQPVSNQSDNRESERRAKLERALNDGIVDVENL